MPNAGGSNIVLRNAKRPTLHWRMFAQLSAYAHSVLSSRLDSEISRATERRRAIVSLL